MPTSDACPPLAVPDYHWPNDWAGWTRRNLLTRREKALVPGVPTGFLPGTPYTAELRQEMRRRVDDWERFLRDRWLRWLEYLGEADETETVGEITRGFVRSLEMTEAEAAAEGVNR